jgi:arylsulfatase A-like enzyme
MIRCLPASLAVLVGIVSVSQDLLRAASHTNVIIVYADDLGNGDLGCYGHPQFRTPNIDRMAAEGARLTNFYSTAPNCTPSRTALNTGRYQFRSGLTNVLNPDSRTGIADSELTLGEAFKQAGYATACIGKWHLGHLPQFNPTRHGYDSYFGILYSNDMHPVELYSGEKRVEYPVQQATLTKVYTEKSIAFIRANKEKPFFLYLPHAMPHKPLAASEHFYRKSKAGLYGDAVAELDWSVGQVFKVLKEEGLDGNTLVFFSSDNGPWYGGRTGGLRGMKGTTFEGGIRVPLIARWPGRIAAGKVSGEPAFICDLYTTALKAANISIPSDRIIDGKDIMPLLASNAKSPHKAIFSYHAGEIRTVRSGKWKLHVASADVGGLEKRIFKPEDEWVDPRRPDGVNIIAPIEGQAHPSRYPGVRGGDAFDSLALFDLDSDPAEQHNVAAKYPEVVEQLKQHYLAIKATEPQGAR